MVDRLRNVIIGCKESQLGAYFFWSLSLTMVHV